MKGTGVGRHEQKSAYSSRMGRGEGVTARGAVALLSSILKIFFWYEESSDEERLSVARIANLFPNTTLFPRARRAKETMDPPTRWRPAVCT